MTSKWRSSVDPAAAAIRVNDGCMLAFADLDLPQVRVSVAFLELLQRIIRGYRPNKHDKTSVVVLEELVEAVTRRIRTSDSIHIQYGDQEWVLRNDVSNDEIVVES